MPQYYRMRIGDVLCFFFCHFAFTHFSYFISFYCYKYWQFHAYIFFSCICMCPHLRWTNVYWSKVKRYNSLKQEWHTLSIYTTSSHLNVGWSACFISLSTLTNVCMQLLIKLFEFAHLYMIKLRHTLVSIIGDISYRWCTLYGNIYGMGTEYIIKCSSHD